MKSCSIHSLSTSSFLPVFAVCYRTAVMAGNLWPKEQETIIHRDSSGEGSSQDNKKKSEEKGLCKAFILTHQCMQS